MLIEARATPKKSSSENVNLLVMNNKKYRTIRGRIYLVKPIASAKCDKKLLRITLSRIIPNPKYNGSSITEKNIYKLVASSESRNNSIIGDIQRGYCDYILKNIPIIKGNYHLETSILNEKLFLDDALSKCTVSPVFSQPLGWENPLTSSSLNTNKDMKLTRVVAKCQP
ncbi:hypothetical protein [Calothrix sp. NIES-3974]|uniref:hypothetical protein n=1 Tax=Calothrix sp. NIES-3974 TaxID=2005462 RepID=UPI0012FD4298|nr:hypothetical protein [Calothrix sp. NIES-3974]